MLRQAVRDPSASMPDGFKPVTIVTRDGQRVRGVRKSEDAFSIQMMDDSGHLRGFLKSGVRDIFRDTNSSCSSRLRKCGSSRGCVGVSGVVRLISDVHRERVRYL